MRHILTSLAFASMFVLAGASASYADDASDMQAFHDYLAQAKAAGATTDKDKISAFYKTTGAYWRAHWLDYSHNPQNYADVMALYHADQALYPRPFVVPDPKRYEKDIQAFRDFDARNTPPKNPALFIGSSTIVKWKTAEAFPGFNVINRGFGGNVIEDVLYYYADTVGKYHPSAIFFYCDNDVTGGDSGDHAFELTMQVYNKIRADFPKVPFVFLSMKHAPNSAFANLGEAAQIDRFNELARAQTKKDPLFKYFDMDGPVKDASGKPPGDLFLDGEHFNDKGYALINPALEKVLVALHVPRSK